MKEFVYLYPISEYIDVFVNPADGLRRRQYKESLNSAVDLRYRQQGFGINYVIFDGHSLSDVIEIQPSDKIIEAGIDFKTHTAKQPNGEYPYPNPEIVLDQLPRLRTIRIGGFHLWDCVEKTARAAYERGLDVLVDEELTEVLASLMSLPDFAVDHFPSYNPRKDEDFWFDLFMNARKNKPWLWQNY